MKYSYLLIFALFIAAGCSSYGDSPERSREMEIYKKQLDSLNRVKKEQQHVLDSLEKAGKLQEEQLRLIQVQQDSLNKILKEENK